MHSPVFHAQGQSESPLAARRGVGLRGPTGENHGAFEALNSGIDRENGKTMAFEA